MKHPEYDSPFELVVSDIATQAARNIDEMSWQAVQRVGIDVNKEKLLSALNQDSERYRKAYKNGYDTGYEKRDEEIIRCKDCVHRGKVEKCALAAIAAEKDYPLFMLDNRGEWFCADGRRVNWDDSGDEAEAAAENENDHPDGGGVSGAGDADRIRGD